jgi:hypothetical protein
MLKTNLKLVYLKLDKGEFTKSVLEAVDTQNRQAARAWLKAVLIIVPTYTGMARGSLKPLGQFLRVAIPINPVAHRRGHSIATGEAKGSFQFSQGKPLATFSFRTDVAHFLINNYYDVSDIIHLIEPVPWQAFKAGADAYDNYIKENLKKKIPKISSFLIREVIQIKS